MDLLAKWVLTVGLIVGCIVSGVRFARASEVDLSFGAEYGTGMRVVGGGYSVPIGKSPFFYRADLGGFWDVTDHTTGSYYGFGSLGLRVHPSVLFFDSWVGAGGVSHTDDRLGGHVQFSEAFRVGLRDKDAKIGLKYRHISSAGTSLPNAGRDFITVDWIIEL